jgi:hypothetical protein
LFLRLGFEINSRVEIRRAFNADRADMLNSIWKPQYQSLRYHRHRGTFKPIDRGSRQNRASSRRPFRSCSRRRFGGDPSPASFSTGLHDRQQVLDTAI